MFTLLFAEQSSAFSGVVAHVLELLLAAFLGTVLVMAGKGLHLLFMKWKAKVDNEALKNLIDKIDFVVQKCVEYTNQTFVNDIKKDGKLTDEQKKEALEHTMTTINDMLSDADKDAIIKEFGNTSTYIETTVESYIGTKKDV